MKKTIAFRADADARIGLGHAMRDLTIASELRLIGFNCVFVCRHLPDHLADRIRDAGHDVLRLEGDDARSLGGDVTLHQSWLGVRQEDDARSTLARLSDYLDDPGQLQGIVLDHYGIDARWETIVRAAIPGWLGVIDDLSDRPHECDWLLDSTFGKTQADYSGLVPGDYTLMLGAEYALLRAQFTRFRAISLARRDACFEKKEPARKVLIAMGGVDQPDATGHCVDALNATEVPEGFSVDIMIGGSYPHLASLEQKIAAGSIPFRIHQNISDVAELLTGVDLCIGASGTSTWERCCLGVPTINVVLAENQKTIARNLTDAGAIHPVEDFFDRPAAAIGAEHFGPVIHAPDELQAMSLAARDICDGRGVLRLKIHLLEMGVKNGRKVRLRLAHAGDIRTVFNWQMLPETRRHANNPEPPSWEGHSAWMAAKLKSPDSYFFIVECDGAAAGVVRLDRDLNRSIFAYVVSIFIDPDFYGLGVASAALELAHKLLPRAEIFAQVHADNKPSLTLFGSNGYSHVAEDWYKKPPLL